jgi:hypothetical protein
MDKRIDSGWREQPGRPALPREHGTPRGWEQHRYRQERACGPCKHAHQLHVMAKREAA